MYSKYQNEMDNLFADNKPDVITEEVVIASGVGEVKRGTLLGKITASGKCIPCDSTAADGSEKPYSITTDTVDATAADVTSTGYMSGSFQENNVIFSGADDADTHREALRSINIYLK